MIELDYASLRAAPVDAQPFAHVVVPHFVPPQSLAAVLADLPTVGKRGSFPVSAVGLGPAARALIEEMEGPRLRDAIAAKFGL
ncbi:MAG: 2OG-Fe(II) oxygenase, partial [Acetobacteraceae bacterium]|nr:2OG-Fe(II) oxygenase [Acetobacteraceae bacterium]